MNVMTEYAHLDGHDQLAALLAAGRQPPIGETLNFRLVEIERGRVVFEGMPDHRVLNPIGSLHGAMRRRCSTVSADARCIPVCRKDKATRRSN